MVAVTLLAALPRPATSAQTPQVCDSLEVLILLDESGSIDTNDPHDQRIEATKEYLANLRTSRQVDISVAVAGFASTFKPYSDGFLDLDTEAERLDRLVEDFADRHREYRWDDDEYRWHTDYIEAFRGILEMPWSADCRRTVWFSDGQHDLDHRARPELLPPRPYDALRRDLTDRQSLAEVEGLLIPTVCGQEDTRSQISAGYFGLADRFNKQQMPAFEIMLFYLEGDQPYGETLRLFEMLNRKGCGDLEFEHRPVEDIDHLPDDLLFNAACSSLPGTTLDQESLTARRDAGVVWDGTIPSPIAPEFVTSVELLASPGRATLETDHGRAEFDTSNSSIRRLRLDFDRQHRFLNPRVAGSGVEQICGSVTFGHPDLSAKPVTSPIMAGQPADFALTTGSHQENPRPLSAEEQARLTVRRDGETLETVHWTEEGTLRDPAAPAPGTHTYRFELKNDPPVDSAMVSIPVEVEGVALNADLSTPRVLAGQPVEFSLQADSQPLTPEQQSQITVFRDDQELKTVWTDDGTLRDPAAPAPGTHTYRFELRVGDPAGWAAHTVRVETEALPFNADLLSSPVLAGRPVEFSLQADSQPLTPEQQSQITVFRDDQELKTVWTDDGTLRDPAAPAPGTHTYRFELRGGDPAGWVIDSFDVKAEPQPPGPIMELDHARLRPLLGTDLTVPVKTDDTPGCIELDTAVMVATESGDHVSGQVGFPDRNSTWCSGSNVEQPTDLWVELERQVNTDQGFAVLYVSVSVQDERQLLEMSVPGPIDRERNPTVERILSILLLLILFALLWLALYGINRRAGRLPRQKSVRYAEFAVDGSGETEIGEDDHRSPRWAAGRIQAGRMRAVRKTPFWRVWHPPYAELSLSDAPSLAVMGGDPVTETPARRHRIGHKDRIFESIVLIEEGGSRGTVMAGIRPDSPAGEQLTRIVDTALDRTGHRSVRRG